MVSRPGPGDECGHACHRHGPQQSHAGLSRGGDDVTRGRADGAGGQARAGAAGDEQMMSAKPRIENIGLTMLPALGGHC
eukprot:scaffold61110_cov37-Prasinocladus_malaysianus.AAC.1